MIRRIKHGTEVPILGEIKTICFEETRMIRPRVVSRLRSLHVYIGESSNKTHLDQLESHLREILKQYILEKIDTFSLDERFSFNKVRVKNVTSRWGSCSSKRNLNFNIRLAFCPLDSIDYVIIHELCHLVEMNHSKRFWNLVGSLMPDYKVHQKWLKENGISLL